jgi:intein-encoded DNA endonuclease-like protein
MAISKALAIKLYDQGHNPTAIARAYNMAPYVVHKMLKEHKEKKKNDGNI